jgi:hypothetical protein
MNRLLSICLFGLLCALGPNEALAAQKVTPAQMRETLHQLELDLREARGLAAAITDKGLRGRMEKLIERMEQRREQLAKQLGSLGGEPARRAVADADFARFLKALKDESFDDRKLALLRDYARQSHFSSAQAKLLVKEFSFSKGQTEAAIALHPRLVDPANFFEVLGVLTFESDKKKVREALGLK